MRNLNQKLKRIAKTVNQPSSKLRRLLLGSMLGIILASQNEELFLLTIVIFSIFALLYKHLIIISIFIILGGLYFNNYSAQKDIEMETLLNTEANLEGEIIDEPIINDFSQELIIKVDNINSYFLVKTAKYPLYSKGESIRVTGFISQPKESKFFDRRAYLLSKNILFEINNPRVEIIEEKNISYSINEFKIKLTNIINSKMNEPEASLLNGIIFGKDFIVQGEFENSFKNSGLSHITSVSGYNISIIALFFLKFNKFWKRKYLLILSLIIIYAFILMIGTTNLPALRATIMLSYLVIADLIGRKAKVVNAILISILAILLIYPLYYLNISFQLSFFATVGLFLLPNVFTSFFLKCGIPKVLSEILSATISANLATLPITLLTFGEVQIISLISNLVVLPLVPLITLLSFLGIAMSISGLEIFSLTIFQITELVLKIISFVSLRLGSIKGSDNENLVTILIFCGIFLLLSLFLHRKNKV